MERRRERAIMVPPYMAPSEEELGRRREVFKRILERRERMEPLGCSVVELLRDDEDEGEEDQEHPEANK